MESKLQELTDRLYEEGLSKGRADADKLLAEAQAEAERIVAEAEKKAGGIVGGAKKSAEELRRNTMTEISLAGKQAVKAIKDNISDMITAKAVSGAVQKTTVDPQFIKEMLLAVAANWDGASAGKVTLSALLPAQMQEKFAAEFSGAAVGLLKEGIEVGYSDRVKSGFRIGERDGRYYIGFSDADFDALFKEFLNEKVAGILYGE